MPDLAALKPARFSGRSARFGSVPFPIAPNRSPHGQVTALSMMKDEAVYAVEWVAHHLAIGFTDLVIYTNDCSDGTDTMLDRMEALGLVHHRLNAVAPGLRPQPSALGYGQDEPVVQAADWLMVFDADEFLSIRHSDGSLDGLLTSAEAAGATGIVVTWRVFGSDGRRAWSPEPVTEQYLSAAPVMWNKGWGVKTLYRHDANAWKLGIHRPKLKSKLIETEFPDRIHWLNGSGKPMEDYFKFRGWRSIARTVGYDWVQLNHYAVKSAEAYALRRLRGNVNNKADKYNSAYWALQDRNEVQDDTMLRYRERRGAIMAALLADPVVGGLHRAALERVEARLAEIRPTAAYADLMAALETAAQIPISQITAAPPKPRDRERIASLMSDVERRRSAVAKTARKAEAAPVPPVATPVGIYVRGPVDPGRDVPLEWVANHAIRLPADPRVFTPVGLDLLKAGRIDRALARRLPGLLPKGASIIDVGAASGFLAAQIGKARPDLRLRCLEEDEGLRAIIARVWAENGCLDETRLTLLPVGAALVDQLSGPAPVALLLGAPSLAAAEVLDALARGPAPEVIVLHGRAVEAAGGQVQMVAERLPALGYMAAFDFDPTVALGFRRVLPAATGG